MENVEKDEFHLIYTNYAYTISWLALVNQVVFKDDINRTG